MTARMLSPWFMRDHFWTRRHLSEFIDGELGAAQQKRVERHVHLCRSCHRLLTTLRATLEELHALRHRRHDGGVADAVIERLRLER